MLTMSPPGDAVGAASPRAAGTAATLESLPLEVLDIVAGHLDVRSLCACVQIKPLFEAAVNILWRDVVLPAHMSAHQRVVARLLRRGGTGPANQTKSEGLMASRRPTKKAVAVYPYQYWIRSLSVAAPLAEIPAKAWIEITTNLVGSLLRKLVISFREGPAQQVWRQVFEAQPALADQIRELHLVGVGTITGDLVNVVSKFHNLESLRLEIRDASRPDMVQNLLNELIDAAPSLHTLEFSDSAAWIWKDDARLEGTLGTLMDRGEKLTTLCLRGFRFVGEHLLKGLGSSLANLEHLALKDFWLEEDSKWDSLFEQLPKLRTLRMENTTKLAAGTLIHQTDLRSLSLLMDFPSEFVASIASHHPELEELDLRGATMLGEMSLNDLAPLSGRLSMLYLDHLRLDRFDANLEFPMMTRFGLGPSVQTADGKTPGVGAARMLFQNRYPLLHTVGLAAFYGDLGDRVDHQWLSSTFLAAHLGLLRVFLGKASTSFVAPDKLPQVRRKHPTVLLLTEDWFPGIRWA